MNLQPVTLVGERVRLEPLAHRHAEDLLAASSFDDVWTYLDEPTPLTMDDITAVIDDALEDLRLGRRIPFAMIDVQTNRTIGSTSYIDIRPHHRGVEIGWTWLTPSYWGRGFNREAKYLLLRHAFDQGAIRVAIKTDSRNTRNQRVIESLGATREGTWRNHMILSTGSYRDSTFYSITEDEWPPIAARLAQPSGQPCPPASN